MAPHRHQRERKGTRRPREERSDGGTVVDPVPSKALDLLRIEGSTQQQASSTVLSLQRHYGNTAVAGYLTHEQGGQQALTGSAVRRLVQRQEEDHKPLEVAPNPVGAPEAIAATDQEPEDEAAVQRTPDRSTIQTWTPPNRRGGQGTTGTILGGHRGTTQTTGWTSGQTPTSGSGTQGTTLGGHRGTTQTPGGTSGQTPTSGSGTQGTTQAPSWTSGQTPSSGSGTQGMNLGGHRRPPTESEYKTAKLQALNGSANAGQVTSELTTMKNSGFGWNTHKAIFSGLSDTIKGLIRGNDAARQAAFQLCATGTDKGELLYLLGGSADWKRATMTEQSISHDDMREGLVRLGVFEHGTAGHKRGAEVDQLIQTHLSNFVQTNLDARGRIEGRIAVVGEADWDVIGRHQYGSSTWDGGKKNTLNAFVDRSSDPPRVFVNKDRGNAGTAIHEACHMWGDPGRPINGVSHDLNEGVTEYFARKVCNALTPPIPRSVYGQQFNIAKKLVDKIGEDKVGSAFFDGNLNAIKNEFTDDQWTNFIDAVNNKQWSTAAGILNGLGSTTTTAPSGSGGSSGP